VIFVHNGDDTKNVKTEDCSYGVVKNCHYLPRFRAMTMPTSVNVTNAQATDAIVLENSI